MLQANLIGNVGADAQLQEKDGRKFTTFRVAHNDRWTDRQGQVHDSTQWIDCILNDHPKVVGYIKQGQMVYVSGSIKTRVYSSEKDRCMKAGITINVARIELLGGNTDPVPSRLYDKDGVMHNVHKYYQTDVKSMTLVSARGQQFMSNDDGWILSPQHADTQLQQQQQTTGTTTDNSADNAPVF